MKKTLLYLLVAVMPVSIYAQNKISKQSNYLNSSTIKRCGTTEKMEELRALNPALFDANKAAQEQILQEWITKKYSENAKVIYTIPVVVQIFGTTANNAITDNRVFEQIDVLTKDYRRLNSDTTLTPTPFKSIAADCEIEFCLATLDPQGAATNGIVRKTGSNSPTNNDLWNTSQYLNLLVYSIGGGTLGYTYLPSQAPNNGVHISYQYFGKTGASSPYNKGRTASHEVGHWLNLEHIWGDSNCGNDQVSDTPTQQNETYGCPSYPNAAGCNSPNPPGRMFMNYMDYSDDACMNSFSAGQKARMVAAINNYRPGLINNGKCGSSQPTPPTAAFIASQTTITAGTCISFTDQSTGSPTSWAWSFPGAATTTSTQQNPTNICFNDTGCFNVTLIATNADGSDTLTKTCFINVVPQGAQICDTVSSYQPTDTPTLLGSGGWGYVTGHNDYDDRAKADFFSATPGGYEITGAKFWFARAYAGSTGATVDVKIWADNSGTPGSALYSQTVPISSLLLYPAETVINFTTPQTVSGNYFLGVEFSANGTPQDTIALISNADGETNPGTGWELWSDATWHAISEPNTGWGINLSQAIWAIRCPADTSGCPNITVSSTVTNVSCSGGTNGTISVSASGGASPYTFLWSNGANTSAISNLSAGTFSCTATDVNGCDGIVTATVTAPVAISGSATTVNAACGSNNGSATVTATGGTPGYTFLWNNGQTTTTATGLSAGNYSVTITDSKGCTATTVASVSNTNAPVVIAGSTNASAYGVCDGSASANATGGTTPYTYLWSNGATTSSISGLCAGTYNVTVTDGASCAGTGSTVVSQPVGISSPSESILVNVFPNPTNGKIFADIQLRNTEDVVISVYNILGEKIISTKRNDFAGGKIEIDLSHASKGIYFVEIGLRQRTLVKKISLIQ